MIHRDIVYNFVYTFTYTHYIMRIKELIKEKGYTQQEFADILGITRVTLAHVISGKPSYTTLERIAGALQVPVWQLLVAPEDVQGDDFCAFVRYKGKHYTADNATEFQKIVEEVKKTVLQDVQKKEKGKH